MKIVYVQKEGLDYEETFAPITRLEIVISIIAIASHFSLVVYQMIVQSTFLNG